MFVLIGFGRGFPNLDDRPELILVVEDVLSVPHVPEALVLNVNPFSGEAPLPEQLSTEALSVELLPRRWDTGKFAERGEKIGEINQVFA